MSNVVEPQITETKPSAFGNFIKSNPKLINDLFSGGFPSSNMPVKGKGNGEPYVFLQDFSFINSTTDGSIGSTMVNYKKGQVVYPFPSSPNAKIMRNPAFTKAINEGVLVLQITANNKVPLSVSNPTLVANMKLEEEKKFSEKKKKFMVKTLAKASIVPIGLYAFSKYQKYDTKKTLKVTIIGSVVILGAVVLNGLSGAWSGTTYLDSLMGKSKKPLEPSITPKVAIEPTPTPIPNKPKSVGNLMPIDWSNTLFGAKNCPNGTKKLTVACAVAPCPEMEVCA